MIAVAWLCGGFLFTPMSSFGFFLFANHCVRLSVSVFNGSAAVLSTDPYHLRRDLTLMALNFNRIGDFSTFASGWARWACEYVGVLFSPFFMTFASAHFFHMILYFMNKRQRVNFNSIIGCCAFHFAFSHVHNLDICGDIFLCWMPPPTHLIRANNSIYFVNFDVMHCRERWQSCPHTRLFVHTQAHTHFFSWREI